MAILKPSLNTTADSSLREMEHGRNADPKSELRLTSSDALVFRDAWVHSPQKEQIILDLSECPLPRTPFGIATTIAERDDMKLAILQVLQAYHGANIPNKSRSVHLRSIAMTLTRVFEYGWLNGIYLLSDWTSGAFDQLAIRLRSGWTSALELPSRLDSLLKTMSKDEIQSYWAPLLHSGRVAIAERKLAMALRTNLRKIDAQLRLQLRSWAESTGVATLPPLGVSTTRASQGRYRSYLDEINLLGKLSSGGVSFLPFSDASALVRRAALTPTKRTSFISPDVVARIISIAIRWVKKIGPILIEITESLCERYSQKQSEEKRTISVFSEMKNHFRLRELEELLGLKVVCLIKTRRKKHDDEVSFNTVLMALYAACFMVIALLNARRKDEIEHPNIGLQSDSLVVINESLDLFACRFFIEKSINSHVSFYVGGVTAEAIQTLVRLSAVARRLREFRLANQGLPCFHKNNSIFEMPVFGRRPEAASRQWMFDISTAACLRCKSLEVFSEWSALKIHAHMLRRAYALIFHYRHEHATLLALSQQLGHFDIAMTRVYVSDTPSTESTETGAARYGRLTSVQRIQLDIERKELDGDLSSVGQEKLLLFVESVVSGAKSYSGGYVKLVQRFHQRMGRLITYAPLDHEAQAGQLARVLIEHGHEPYPMAHGTCMAGENLSRLRGHCYSEQTQHLERSTARAVVCATCSYHVVTAQHLQALESDYQAMSITTANSEGTSLQGERRRQDWLVLGRLLELHRRRIKMPDPPSIGA